MENYKDKVLPPHLHTKYVAGKADCAIIQFIETFQSIYRNCANEYGGGSWIWKWKKGIGGIWWINGFVIW